MALVGSMGGAAAANKSVTEIAPYVYPANAPASVVDFAYMPDGLSYLAANADNTLIKRHDTKTGAEIEVVFDASKTRESKIDRFESFTLSPDGSKLLIMTNRQMIYRRSFKAAYYVFEIKRGILRPLSTDHAAQQAPIFSPDNRMVAFVADNNIFIKKLDYGNEVPVTKDGAPGQVINGVPDWTYEEEFTTNSSIAWSPDSETLCYLRYDESQVPTYSFPIYQGSCDPLDQYALYPGQFSYKYPVAGQSNSVVTLHSYDVDNRKVKDLQLPDPRVEYIPRIIYASNEQLLAVTLDRDQNRMEIYSVNPKSTTVKSLLVEESKAWINPSTYEAITLTANSLILMSDRSGFTHLYEYSLAGAMLRQLTDGDFDVTACYGRDASGNLYYQSATPSPLCREVKKIDIKGRVASIDDRHGTVSVSFSPAKNFYTLSYSSSTEPPVISLHDGAGKRLRVLEDNAAYRAALPALSPKEFITIPSDGYELNAYVVKPLDFSPSKKYPVIMWQYSGPGSQEVKDSWSLDWQQYAASQGFIVVCVDGRGTGFRGRRFQDVVYRDLGHYETIDQINAARAVATWSFVDGDRIGICGWSYGGYETLMAISAGEPVYSAAVAIAPVTDWRYYDTVYAERYMLTPQANDDGYLASAPINRVAEVSCPLLLVHGTADDNVHLSNTIEYVSKLQSQGILCDMLLFPNMNHSIYGCGSRALVYAKMVNFFKANL